MAFTRPFIGDTGTGGIEGLVPAPGAGDAAAGKFLSAAGTWAVPAGGGGGGGHVIQDNGANKTARSKLNFTNFTVVDNAGADSTDITFDAPVDSVNGQTGTVSLDTDDIAEGANLYYTDARVRANRLDQMANPTADVSANYYKITNVADPIANGDAVNKNYVDAIVQGLQLKPSAVAATAAALAAYTYNNGASGAGATITMNATGVLTIDGVTIAIDNYVLIKDETGGNKPYNGLYKCTTAGAIGVAAVLTRAAEMNTTTEFRGAFVFIEGGSTYAATGWACTNTTNITVGTTDVAFVQFSEAGAYIDGAGLSLSGRTFAVNVDGTTIEINSDSLRVKDAGISYAKIQNVSATDKILGRSTAGAGVVEEITCTSFARSILDDANAAAARATLGLTPSMYDAGNSGTSKTLDFAANGNLQKVTLTGDCTFTLTPPSEPGLCRVKITQDGTGGRTATFTGVRWSQSVPPEFTPTIAAVDFLTLFYDGTDFWGANLYNA